MTSGVDWARKLFDINDQVCDVIDRDNLFSTYGEYCCGIFAAFDQYGEHKNQATGIPFDSSMFSHCSIIPFDFCLDTWYKRHPPLGGETPFNYLNLKDNPSQFDPL
jgi:hypothetical protein